MSLRLSVYCLLSNSSLVDHVSQDNTQRSKRLKRKGREMIRFTELQVVASLSDGLHALQSKHIPSPLFFLE